LPGVEHSQHNRLNNRAENSHQPTWQQQEKQMRKFKSPKQAQRFLPVKKNAPLNQQGNSITKITQRWVAECNSLQKHRIITHLIATYKQVITYFMVVLSHLSLV
jgi:uncharacterized protein YaaR (DUF327 family)